jgi:hypothetical protein
VPYRTCSRLDESSLVEIGKERLQVGIRAKLGSFSWCLGIYHSLGGPNYSSTIYSLLTPLQIFPVSLLCALSSLTTIAGFIRPLANYLARHPKTAAAITSLAPVILVASLTLCICPILLVIANKAETINTRLGVHNSVLERFWKFREHSV